MRVTRFRTLLAADAVLAAWPGTLPHRLRRFTKPVLMPVLGGALLADPPVGPAPGRASALVGIGLSGVGDVALLGRGSTSFVSGLGAFLGAHVAYAVGFARIGGWDGLRRSPAAAVPALGVAVAGAAALLPRAGELRLPVAGYIAVISSMTALACGTRRPDAVLGAGLFCASDLLLGWSRFRGAPVPLRRLPGLAEAAVMATYGIGQERIARALAGRTDGGRRPSRTG